MQTGGYTSPLRRGETLDIAPEDGERLGVADGEIVRAVSRRGAIEVPVRYDETLRPGLAFMTLHFQDEVATNILTIDAIDPKSGTAEFKASAIRIERVGAGVRFCLRLVSVFGAEGRGSPRRELDTRPRVKVPAWTSTSSPAPTPPPRSVRPSTR